MIVRNNKKKTFIFGVEISKKEFIFKTSKF